MGVAEVQEDRIAEARSDERPVPLNVTHRPDTWLDATVTRRRYLVLSLNAVTIALLLFAMISLMSTGGMILAEWVMLIAYGITLPWLSIGLWNSLIGFALDRKYRLDAAEHVTPALGRISGHEPIRTKTAIIMPLRNEDPSDSLRRFADVQRALGKTRWGAQFEFHVLSDSDHVDIILREEAAFAKWRTSAPDVTIEYRRRDDNSGYKAGNVAEFLERCGDRYDFFIPLDADSVMGAETVLRLVRVMQTSPEIGILQSLVTGLPSKTFFTRAFQFGMRHGMRSYTLGSAWWQADCGPNWGHNAIMRAAAFREHCMLPVLPGSGPLSGHILSHDQLEAALMRRAGYEVRVLAEESESHEENPPSLADFIRRELRWCNGNMQYLRMLGQPGLLPVSRIQLYLAIQMYLAAPAWIVFILVGAGLAAVPKQFEGISVTGGLALFAVLMTLNLMPKLMGLGQILAEAARAEAYGGRKRVVVSGAAEILVSMLMAPIVAFGLTIFLIGLVFGKRVGWDAQQRSRARLHWSEAVRVLWPQTMAGLALAVWLAAFAPWALLFAAPMLLSFCFAIPIAVLSTTPALSQWSIRRGLFDIPEDRREKVPLLEQDLQADAA
ncbi:glucans biosynthesis glucosyltransferase MdoH [uncultured Roseobacter sp.]|uniref:glucans biosynthesis glucosyltransferase MdoH n=1 Tax=uncultured Roseobacter sp. TaxID=114847 RepID=UPI00262E3C7A|nr:glucans biosynthesis glucosyltransferase MdoH [uncultured Roseobacter sp.]